MHAARFPRIAPGTLGLLLAAGACAQPLPVEVAISRSTFVPREITIEPGTRVVWTNQDEIPHTVSGRDREPASPALDTGDRYAHAFETEGDYGYFCAVHPYMMGVVHVRKRQAAADASPAPE
jgi:plastocyanin